MNRKLGVTSFFYGFLTYLCKRRRKIAPLQLSGRLEDYLVHEFIAYIFDVSKGARFAFTNMGKTDEQKIDITIVSGDHKQPHIRAMIEAKYLRNRHRIWGGDAEDEITTTLRSLKEQLHQFTERQHADLPVKLLSHDRDIYGLVLASYVYSEGEGGLKDKEEFYKRCLSKATQLGFRYHDLPKPYWRPAFEDERVEALGHIFSVSLRAGLWRLSASA